MKLPHSFFLTALSLSIAIIASGSISGCKVSTGGVSGGVSGGEDVTLIDPKARKHFQTKLTMTDYVALAGTVTNKMLVHELVQNWGDKRPRVITEPPVNNTDDEGIRMEDLHDRIQEILFGSGVIRVMNKSAKEFDYAIRSELTSTQQYGKGGEKLVHFTLQLKIFTADGELKGQWSDDLTMLKGI